jgi:hypothetical protein
LGTITTETVEAKLELAGKAGSSEDRQVVIFKAAESLERLQPSQKLRIYDCRCKI